jgi:UDP-4-amino-4-deoxy-L-arabinose-oxoglutarate aminotransferase
MHRIPFYRHQLGSLESTAISNSLDREILTSGEIGDQVEKLLCNYFEIKFTCLVNSWTNGALATLIALNVGPGDEVIIPAMTFVACANVVELVGATPVFCDVNQRTLLLDLDQLPKLLTNKTRVVMPVHLYGQMNDVEKIRKLVGDEIYIIEDCAHSFEATFDTKRPGKFSDAAIFSFYATKNITCGEGGAIISNNVELITKIRKVILHGMSIHAKDRFRNGRFQHWDVDLVGIKANLPDILASLLPSQLNIVDTKLTQRESIAIKYRSRLINHSEYIRLPEEHNQGKHARHLFPIFVSPNDRDNVISLLSKYGIGSTVNFRSIPDLAFYSKKYPHAKDSTPVSSRWGNGVLSLPIYPGLQEDDVCYIIDIIESVILNQIQKI